LGRRGVPLGRRAGAAGRTPRQTDAAATTRRGSDNTGRRGKLSAMAMRELRVVGDPVLRTPCEPITQIDERVRALVADLLETVDDEGRAGLAANQIGVSLRAFSWNIDDEVGYVLNPRLVATSEEEYQDGDEGCLSVPGLWFPTERAWYARVEGIDLDGEP